MILPISFPLNDPGSIRRASNGRYPPCPTVYLFCTCYDFSTWLMMTLKIATRDCAL